MSGHGRHPGLDTGLTSSITLVGVRHQPADGPDDLQGVFRVVGIEGAVGGADDSLHTRFGVDGSPVATWRAEPEGERIGGGSFATPSRNDTSGRDRGILELHHDISVVAGA